MWKKMIIPMVMLAFAACGDNSSSADEEALEDQNFTTDEGSSAVAYTGDGIFYKDKVSFEIDSAKKSISVYEAECKVQGNKLIWTDGKDGKATPLTYKYNSSSKSINVQKGGEKFSMKFYGDSFPYGQWIEPNTEIGNVYNGFSLHESGSFNYTKYFGDSCLVDNLVAIKAFPGFADPAKMEKVDCSTAKYGDVEIVYEKYNAGVAKIVATKGDDECEVTITPRYKSIEEDCNDAYDDYKDAEDGKPFNFADYSAKIEGDVECFESIVK